LSESEDWSRSGLWRHSAALYPQANAPSAKIVAFSRSELNSILRVYGRKVSEGMWRDYAIDHLSDRAVFSIYRRTSEFPLYRVEKVPALARKQGAYSLIAAGGAILKRGHDLATLMRFLDRPKLSVVAS
jgi:hypothetical protein